MRYMDLLEERREPGLLKRRTVWDRRQNPSTDKEIVMVLSGLRSWYGGTNGNRVVTEQLHSRKATIFYN